MPLRLRQGEGLEHAVGRHMSWFDRGIDPEARPCAPDASPERRWAARARSQVCAASRLVVRIARCEDVLASQLNRHALADAPARRGRPFGCICFVILVISKRAERSLECGPERRRLLPMSENRPGRDQRQDTSTRAEVDLRPGVQNAPHAEPSSSPTARPGLHTRSSKPQGTHDFGCSRSDLVSTVTPAGRSRSRGKPAMPPAPTPSKSPLCARLARTTLGTIAVIVAR